MQGDWLNFDAVLEADLSWNALIYALRHELFKFLINSTHNVLPTPDNLKRWGRAIVDIKCSLCGSTGVTLKHILNGCPMALNQGRFTWRHDNILECLVKELQPKIDKVNSMHNPRKNIRDSFIKFVKEGNKGIKKKSSYKHGILYTANDWILTYDRSHDPLVFPPHIVQTSLRPDMVIYSNSTKQVILIELTVPTEDNIIDWHAKKEEKYAKLLDDINMNKWKGHIYGIEVGSRGYVAKSVVFALKKLGLEQFLINSIRRKISLACLRSSYLIYLSRKNSVWRPWENRNHLKSFPAKLSVPEQNPNIEQHDFVGFTKQDIHRAKIINEKKVKTLINGSFSGTSKRDDFIGFTALQISKAKTMNSKKLIILREKLTNSGISSGDPSGSRCPSNRKRAAKSRHKQTLPPTHSKNTMIAGLTNLGNTCYMNAVMQCLNSLGSLVMYFKGGEYLKDIHPGSKYDGTLANEISATFKTMNSTPGPISLSSLKNLIGNLYSPFKGFEQEDAHEFLIKLVELLFEDLSGAKMASPRSTPVNIDVYRGQADGKASKILEILQGTHRITILCRSCQYTTSSFEPFNVLSLSPSPTKKSNIKDLLRCYYGDTNIDYTCPACNKQGFSFQKYEIEKLPQVLIIHLKRFDVDKDGVRKNHQFVDFPLKNLKVCNGESLYNLVSITNHYGTLSAGHYTSFCKLPSAGDWYKCDDSVITKMAASVKSSSAYMLFYELSQN